MPSVINCNATSHENERKDVHFVRCVSSFHCECRLELFWGNKNQLTFVVMRVSTSIHVVMGSTVCSAFTDISVINQAKCYMLDLLYIWTQCIVGSNPPHLTAGMEESHLELCGHRLGIRRFFCVFFSFPSAPTSHFLFALSAAAAPPPESKSPQSL